MSRPAASRIDYFWAHVQKTETCWLWTGRTKGRQSHKYPNMYSVKIDGKWKEIGAHRWSYEYFIGPIPDKYTIDHVWARGCTSTLCVNPDHLEAVTRGENTLRGNTASALHARQTHCIHGHPFDEENTYWDPSIDTPRRLCKECRHLRYLREKNKSYNEEKMLCLGTSAITAVNLLP